MKTKRPAAALAALFITTIALARPASPLDEARGALKANNLSQAESLLLPLTGEEATDAAAFHLLGQLRERERKFKEAVAAYEQATKLDTTKADYFSALGIALSKRMGEMNFMQQAIVAGKMKKAFEKSVELDPKHVSGLIGLVRYYVNAPEIAGGSLEKAAEFGRRVRDLAPFQGEMELGDVAMRDEKYAEALARFEAATQLNSAHGYARYRCGQALLKLGRNDEARTSFETAVKLDPKLDAAKKALAGLDAGKN